MHQLEKIRHSLAHLLATTVLEKDPETKLGIGPVIENGFYYDILTSKPISEEELSAIETRMREMIKQDLEFKREEINAEKARKIFKDQPFKLELIEELADKNEQITIYKTSSNIKGQVSDVFADLCQGHHIENTQEINPDAFKITRLAGAYWRGDEKNQMLTRIYGIAFETKEELDNYLNLQEEAKKRDHRKIGKELDLFAFSDLIGSGLPLFTPKGTAMRDAIVDKIQGIQKELGYQKVSIPHITKKDLYEKSGHWQKFGEELFRVKGASDAEFVMKPMNCPHHTQIFASRQRSYKELPVRYAETTTVYRDEQAGELLGLSRVRSITQDDGHVFCALEQIGDEARNIIYVIKEFYSSLGMFKEGGYWVSLSVRDPKEDKYLGNEENWQKAEAILEEVAKNENLNYKRVEGEAAFYGPKLDFMFKDALGRERQLATIQLDFIIPERFGLEYTDKDNKAKTPVMIHRAIAGSLERFLGIIIEHFAGAFPLWLSPVQVKVLPIGETHREYARKIYETLKENNFRAEIDDSDNILSKKIKDGKLEKVPYLLVIGSKEIETNTATVENRDKGKEGQMEIPTLLEKLKTELNAKI